LLIAQIELKIQSRKHSLVNFRWLI